VIHSDFERGFIRAETIGYEEFERVGSLKAAREQGVMRSEGRSTRSGTGTSCSSASTSRSPGRGTAPLGEARS
jgi:ribosome-binding ATPase YchF (GTP1/OBG family)